MIFSEAIKLKDGVFHHINYHQERIERTLHAFFQTAIDLSVIHDMIPGHMKSGLFKCRVLYSGKIEKVEFIPYFFRDIRKVGVITDDEIDYSYKYADRSYLNRLLQKSGCNDIIIVKNGLVTDASSSNLVFKSPKGLFTPEDYLLPGTKRRLLLDQKKIKEQRIRVEDIKTFDTVYFINAMIDLEDDIKVQTSSLLYL
jgi:4-amino-4-deoxychorismate lyase